MKEQAAKGTHDTVKGIVDSIEPGDEPLEVLDAPCGSGVLSTALSDKGCSVSALDIVPVEGGDAFSAREHDLNEPLPFEDASFDVCISIEGVEHLDRPTDFFREMVRVLKPGGRLVMTTPNTEALHSRFRIFAKGYAKHFRPESGSRRESGHVHAIDRVFMERCRLAENLSVHAITTNDYYGRKFPWPLLAGLLTKRLPEMYRTDVMLYGDVIIYHFLKPH